MPTFGEAVIAILVEIIRSVVVTAMVIVKNVALLFQILIINAKSAPPLALFIAAAILLLVLFALFKFLKAEAKTLIIALIIFAVLALLVVLL